MDIAHNSLPEGEDPYTILSFENDAKLKVTVSFEGDFAALVEHTDDDREAKAVVAANVFGLLYAAFGGEVPTDAESGGDEAA